MIEQPKVTVIIANYNHGQYLKKSIESIRRQSYKNFNIVLIDDGSTDPLTKEVLTEYAWEEDIEPIYNSENKGKWAVLNQALETVTAPYVMIHDADDIALEQKIEAHIKVLMQHDSLHSVAGFYHCFSEENMMEHWNTKFDLSNIESIGHKETYENCRNSRLNSNIGHYVVSPDYEIHGGACLFATQIWRDGLKFTPPDMKLRIQKAEDSDLNTKITLLLQKTSVVKLPLYCYRRNTSTNDAWLRGL